VIARAIIHAGTEGREDRFLSASRAGRLFGFAWAIAQRDDPDREAA